MDLEKLYSVWPWLMRPDDPKAQRRFSNIVELFNFLLDSHPFFKFLPGREYVKVLDVMAGTGIAGAALAKVLALRKLRVSLTVSDVRESDLPLVYEWLRGVDGVDVETVVADVSKINEVIPRAGYYDIILLWGLSTPHLDPWELARTYSALCHLLGDHGVMAMDEADRIFNMFYRVGYKDFLVEGESREGLTVISIHVGYDEKRGVFKRSVYTFPGSNYVATLGFRFWDVAGTSAVAWLFFKDVDLVPPSTHRIPGLSHIILLAGPRRKIMPEDLKTDPTVLRST